MRISKEALLVVLAFTVPLIVELRTMLVWVGIELTVLESAGVGLAIVALVVGWAFLPEKNGNDEGGKQERDVSNGD